MDKLNKNRNRWTETGGERERERKILLNDKICDFFE